MCFLNNVNGRKEPSASILEVGIENALNGTFFDEDMFVKRDGHYEKTRLWARRSNYVCDNQALSW